MILKLPILRNRYVGIISAYGPTMAYPKDIKDKIYTEISVSMSGTPPRDKLIIMGDFNARIGTNFLT
ncbi:hypothetical protein HOLleu_28045 [Holothuria leucospilota]|uniref:Uncharacterized protein n=1 Tax=Holothuria leucospilota TaxID=206669 RepID=A0A9Q1BR82_HOLLE|nr:hypothetical protein HOLleu_28045 [Holothuria leucospilota]